MTEPSMILALRQRRANLARDLEHVATHLSDLDRDVDAAEDALARRSDRAAEQAFDHVRAKREQARAIARARKRELEALDAQLADPTFAARARRFDIACASLSAGPDPRVMETIERVQQLGSEFGAARAALKRIHEERMLAYSEACELYAELGAKHPIEPVCDVKLVLRSAFARGLRAAGANPMDRDVSEALEVHRAEAPRVPYE